MKKLLIIILLSSCSLNVKSKNKCDYCLEIYFEDMEYKINNNDDFILIIKNDECSICQQYNYVLDEYIYKYKIDIYFLDSNYLNLNNPNIINFIDEVKEKSGAKDNAILPATLFYLDGKLINVEIGVLSEKELHNNLELLFSTK